MTTITTRSGKGSPLTNNEVDANFTNLNDDKAELSGATFTGDVSISSTLPLLRLTDTDNSNSQADIDYNFGYFQIDVDANQVDAAEAFRVAIGGTKHFEVSTGGDISFYEDTGTTAKLFWDASAESLGIGTNLASSFTIGDLVVGDGAGARGITIYAATDNESIIRFADGTSGDQQYRGQIKYNHAEDSLNFHANGASGSAENLILKTSEAVFNEGGIDTDFRVESDALSHAIYLDAGASNLSFGSSDTPLSLISTTTSGGIGMDLNDEYLVISRNVDSAALYLNKSNGQAGEIIQMRSDGSKIGVVGIKDDDLVIHDAQTGHTGLRFGNGAIVPVDNTGSGTNKAANLGGNTLRFKDAYFTGVDITNDSDRGRLRLWANASLGGEMRIFNANGYGFIGMMENHTLNFHTNNVERLELGSGEAVFNDISADVDFRVESNNIANMFFVDGGNDRVAVGHSSPVKKFDVGGATGSSTITPTEVVISTRTNASDWAFGPSNQWGILGFYKTDGSGGGAGNIATIGASMQNNVGGYGNVHFQLADPSNSYAMAEWLTLQNSASSGNRQVIISASGGLQANGGAVFNEDSADKDFRVESDGKTHMIYVDAGNDKMALGGTNYTADSTINAKDASFGISADSTNPDTAAYAPLGVTRTQAGSGTVSSFISLTAAGTAVRGIGLNSANALTLGSLTTGRVFNLSNQTATVSTTEFIVNEHSIDADFRVESDNQSHMLFVDAGNDTTFVNLTGPVNSSNASLQASGTANPAALFNRTNDGDIVTFHYNGGGVLGRIRSRSSGGNLELATSQSGIDFGGDGYLPMSGTNITDNAVDIGSSSYRYADLHLSTNIHQGATTPSSSAAGISSEAVGRAIYSRGSGTGGFAHLTFINGNGTIGSVVTSGYATAYNTSSDYRLKENVVTLTGATARLNQLAPKRFNFIGDTEITVDGFLAHEVADVVPEAITGAKDAMRDEEYEVTPAVLDDDGYVVTEAVMGTRSVPDYQGIDQSKLVPLLVATIQELEARIAALESN